jgi:hypothetical protein
MIELRANDIRSAIDTIWQALEAYREDCIPESDPTYDEQWSDICTAMAWIQEDLNVMEKVE